MSDIALVMTEGDTIPSFDFAIANGDIVLDEGLRSSVILSLFTDRLAEADDVLPDGGTDRRGWWGDLPVSLGDERDNSGSRLWLLDRAKAFASTAMLAKHYIAEALQWMIDDGVAKTVSVETQWNAPGFLAIGLNISQADQSGRADSRYDLPWKATL